MIEMAKKAADEDKGAGIHVPLNVVKIVHERFIAEVGSFLHEEKRNTSRPSLD